MKIRSWSNQTVHRIQPYNFLKFEIDIFFYTKLIGWLVIIVGTRCKSKMPDLKGGPIRPVFSPFYFWRKNFDFVFIIHNMQYLSDSTANGTCPNPPPSMYPLILLNDQLIDSKIKNNYSSVL